MKNWKWTTYFGFFLSIIGMILMIIFAFNRAFNDGSGVLNANLASNFGDFIGGLVGPIFSLAGILFLYETIMLQKETFAIQHLENRFFELIRYHRENVFQMEHKIPSEEDKTANGIRVFIEMKKQFEELFDFVSQQSFPHLQNTKFEDEIERHNINIAYLIFYFGVGVGTVTTLSKHLKKKYPAELIDILLSDLRNRKSKYGDTVYFGGHQIRLAHYFRHLFHTVKFINDNKNVNFVQKFEYIQILRAQFSIYEIAIFFFHSLSDLGESWEKRKYVSNYGLIRNLPPEFTKEINPEKYYKIKYQYDTDKRFGECHFEKHKDN